VGERDVVGGPGPASVTRAEVLVGGREDDHHGG
jgi:hypothetical protein